MFVWINNNFENISTVLFELGMVSCFVMICLIPILEKYLWSRFIFFLGFFIILSNFVFSFWPNSCDLTRALNGQYGQHLVETKHFSSDKNAKELRKLSKNEGSIGATATVWCNKKKYYDVAIKQRKGKEEKIVFAYPEPTVKGIKALNKDPYIYVYHKKPKQLKYRFD